MNDVSRRGLMMAGTALAGAAAMGLGAQGAGAANGGFMAASSGRPGGHGSRGPGLQEISALCEVTGGGEKVYGIAIAYDADIDPASVALDTYATSVVPAASGFFPGMPRQPDKNATAEVARPRAVTAIYTNAEPALRRDRKSVAGPYVIAEFAHDPDLSLPSTDSDKVALTQDKPVRTASGVVTLARQNVLIITGSDDDKATPWNETCVPVWEGAGGKVTRPAERLDPALIFPVDRQQKLTDRIDGYLASGGNITFLTFEGVDHMGSARKFFYIEAARDWLFRQVKA